MDEEVRLKGYAEAQEEAQAMSDESKAEQVPGPRVIPVKPESAKKLYGSAEVDVHVVVPEPGQTNLRPALPPKHWRTWYGGERE